jgi:hypothetical protein
LPYIESFETGGLGDRYTASHSFYGGPDDHFQRTDATSAGQEVSTTSGPYTGVDGTYFWAGEDLNDAAGDGLGEKTLTLREVDVSGATDLRFLGRFAAGCNDGPDNSCYDSPDSLVVRYSTDGGTTFTTGLRFAYVERTEVDGSIDRFNEPIAHDTDLDGIGDGPELTPAMQYFGFDIPTPASTIVIQVAAYAKSAGEEFAFDDLRLEAQPLPVELAGFEAHASGRAATLTWRTLTETENAGFDVLHRAPQERDWSRIGFVEGAGTVTTPRTYRFDTGVLSPGEHRFRLRQVDVDGTPTLTGVRTVQVAGGSIIRMLGPNPVRAGHPLRIAVHADDRPVDVALYNVLGQRVQTVGSGWATPAGMHATVATDALAPGLYFLRASGDGITDVKQITVVR